MRWFPLLAAVLAWPVAANEPAPVTPAEQALVARASARGALMYAYDQAAWHGTDAMLTALPNPTAIVGGWIVDGPADAPRLVFYDKARTRAVYIAQFDRGRLTGSHVMKASDDDALSPLDRQMIAAEGAARTALLADKAVFTCASKPFNTVVLPPEAPGGVIAVYFLTPQTSNDAIPLGGHYEVDVDAGGHAGPVRAFTKTCIAAPTHPTMPPGGKPVEFFITHLLDPVPTEVHVFSSLALRLPVAVGTAAPTPRVWIVTGAAIGAPQSLGPR